MEEFIIESCPDHLPVDAKRFSGIVVVCSRYNAIFLITFRFSADKHRFIPKNMEAIQARL
jgi:hypothetical protein